MESEGGGKGSVSKTLLDNEWKQQGIVAVPHFHYVKAAPGPLPGTGPSKRQQTLEHEVQVDRYEFEWMKEDPDSDWDPNNPYEYHIRHADGSVTTYKAKVTFARPDIHWYDYLNPFKAGQRWNQQDMNMPRVSQNYYRSEYNQGAGFEPAATQSGSPHNASGPFVPTAVDTYRPAHRPETNQSAGSAEPVTAYAPAVQFNAAPAPAGPSASRPWLPVTRAGTRRRRSYKPIPLRKQWWAQLSADDKYCIRRSKWWQRRTSDIANQRRWNRLTPSRQMALLRSC